jgi:hypothetical protein
MGYPEFGYLFVEVSRDREAAPRFELIADQD